ncbi:MAG: UvrD-helicase domain-containing protein, partial [Proteobacteria bacterium]|nr:UvrD-helicase domain-containing protein [Pseudomonadota bacterium]
DDMIALPTAMFEAYPDLLERYASAWQYLLVDEYQDTNALQFRLLQLLSSRHANLMVVGDDDQSIYAFRGADSRHILDFPSHFDNVQVVALEQNYRSTQNILDAANAVIAQNATRHAKQLWTSARSDDKIQSCTCPTPEAEATFVIDQILAQRSALNLTYKDFAILYRTNPQNRLLEEACLSKGLPYRIVGGSKFFDQAEVRDLIFYLRAAFSHHDELALRRIVNTPRRGVATATMHHIDEVAKKHQVAFFEALKIVAASDHLRGTTQHKVETFVSTLERFHRRFMAKAEPLAETMQALIDAIHYLPYIQSSSTSDAQAIHRQENVQEFVRTLSAFEQREGRDLFAFIQRLCLEPPQKEENDDDQVTLMTLHASKGLEFPSVTIIGCEENFLPHANALDEPDLSEERRLFYVGITRAKRYLCLTRCEKRQRFHEAIDMQPSRFLADIPETCIETLKPDTQSIQDQQAELKRMAQARFAQLRDLL